MYLKHADWSAMLGNMQTGVPWWETCGNCGTQVVYKGY